MTALLLAMLTAAPPAATEHFRCAFLGLQQDGVEGEIAAGYTSKLQAALAQSGFDIEDANELGRSLSFDKLAKLAQCNDAPPACAAALAQESGVDVVLSGSLVQSAQGYVVALDLYCAGSKSTCAHAASTSEALPDAEATAQALSSQALPGLLVQRAEANARAHATAVAAAAAATPAAKEAAAAAALKKKGLRPYAWLPLTTSVVLGLGGLVASVASRATVSDVELGSPVNAAGLSSLATAKDHLHTAQVEQNVSIALFCGSAVALGVTAAFVATSPGPLRPTAMLVPGGAAAGLAGNF